MSDAHVPAAWYDDPEDATQFRYWDGTAWTDRRAPKGAPAYGAAPAATPVIATPVTPGPLLLAGAALAAAGIGRAVSYLAPYDATAVTILFSVLEVAGWVTAYVAFLMAGYPRRTGAARGLSFTLIGLYAVGGLIAISITAAPAQLYGLFALVGLIGLVTFGVGIAFAVAAIRTPGLARRIATLPLVLYVGLMFFGLVSAGANTVSLTGQESIVIGGISGIVPAVVGALFLVFGSRPHTETAQTVPPAA